MAFPAVNALAFWIMAAALVVLIGSGFVQGGAAISGWTAYPPLSAVASAGPGQGLGMDLWLTAIGLFAISSILSSANLLATVIAHRCEGMTWGRLPLTVWAWFTAAMLTVIAFGVLLAALVLLFCDRHAGTSFFLPAGDLVNGTLHAGGNGSPLLWLHLFWFFGHPEVYIAILPGMGLTSMILANFSRRRVFGYPMMIATTLLIGLLGILVWGHHMFVAGLNPRYRVLRLDDGNRPTISGKGSKLAGDDLALATRVQDADAVCAGVCLALRRWRPDRADPCAADPR